MTNENERYYYRAIGTDLRVISTSNIGQDYTEFMRELRDDLKYSESKVGIIRIEKITVPSQS